MKNLKYFLLIAQILSIPLIAKAQYTLQPAFPNLPNFAYPLELVNADDGTDRLFVVQQRGIIYVFNNFPTVSTRKIFIDLSDKVSQSGSETGLYGLAFHPDYENNRYFYVHYIFDSLGSPSGSWLRISRFETSLTNPDSALINTDVVLITVSLPGTKHNGGKVAFGQDGYLYISFGDGANGGDLAQDNTELLGKILRIDVNSTSPGRNYAIPPTNPFYENTQGYREEIYAYGFRNPWKFSFDLLTNRLWVGDVGEGSYEEIDLIENGKNYGWNKMEGEYCYPDFEVCDTIGLNCTLPIWQYSHGIGQAIMGGYVYRGGLFPDLYGKYIYGDFSQGIIWALTYDGINPPENDELFDTGFLISSFGVDQNNELYVCRYSLFNGIIYKLYNPSVITLDLKAVIEGFYDISNARLNIRDTIRVYLRNVFSPYSIVDSAKTVIDSLTGTGLCSFNNALTGEYYIVVKHRNSIETWSALGVPFTIGNTTVYDFTTSASQAYGNNLTLKGEIYCIYSGDVNQEGIVDISDLSSIYNDVINSVFGYVNTDLTGDDFVDIDDLSIDYNNVKHSIIVITPP